MPLLQSNQHKKFEFQEIGGYTAELFKGSEVFGIYDDNGKELGGIDSVGQVYFFEDRGLGKKYYYSGFKISDPNAGTAKEMPLSSGRGWDEESVRQAARWLYLKSKQHNKLKELQTLSEGHIEGNPGFNEYETIEFPEIGGYKAVVFEKDDRSFIIHTYITDLYDNEDNPVGHVDESGKVYYYFMKSGILEKTDYTVSHDEDGLKKAAQIIYLIRSQDKLKHGEKKEINESTYTNKAPKTPKHGDVVELPEIGISAEYRHSASTGVETMWRIFKSRYDSALSFFHPKSGSIYGYWSTGTLRKMFTKARTDDSVKPGDIVAAMRYTYMKVVQKSQKSKINESEESGVLAFKEPLQGWGAIKTAMKFGKWMWKIFDDKGKHVGKLIDDGRLQYIIPGKYFDSSWEYAEYKFGFDKEGVEQATRLIYLKIHGGAR
jgi:hypothetical protein